MVASTATQPRFLGPDEAAAAGVAVARYPGGLQQQPAFGPAGGPDAWSLTDAGLALAYDMAAVYRLKMSVKRARALELVAAAGEDGLPLSDVPRDLWDSAHVLSLAHTLPDAREAVLAAALKGDEKAMGSIQEESLLIRQKVIKGRRPVYVVTAAGRELIVAADAIKQAAVAAMDGDLNMQDVVDEFFPQQPGFTG
ncbi:hypothetical protein [Alcanivorax sp. 1008]|uniref:hypothetical protein n=1 Tax=Alcanivorax sp. 1008 TaxID=2816853 RepID=UPI001D542184|nr:hypothetical protein [Alcanivorax sp. 1008]MCC1496881.1 hypothetical protein [Alcanivorax sp. 1008]